MKVIVFGATGSVGRHLVSKALAEGHNVTAFVRDPDSLGKDSERLEFVVGDAFDADAVSSAIEGHDAVLCVFGAGRGAGVRAQGTANIIAGMRAHGVSRLICQSTLGAGDSEPMLSFFWKYIMFGLLLRAALADHELQERHVMESGLDWTIVRPAAFTDGPETNSFHHGSLANMKRRALKISRKDVAAFLLSQLSSNAYLHKTPSLSY